MGSVVPFVPVPWRLSLGAYRTGDRCPACLGKSFWIRTVTAECGGCGYAMELEQPATRGSGVFWQRGPRR